MPDRIGDVIEIAGRRQAITVEGCRLAKLGNEELLRLREGGHLTPELLFELQVAVRGNLGRCASTATQDGFPCRRWPVSGQLLCPQHGARLPVHINRAERLLAAIRMPAIEWLAREIDQAGESPCHTCGYPTHSLKERKHFASIVWRLLDRSGLPPTKKVEISDGRPSDVTLDGWLDIEKHELSRHLEQVKALKSRVEARLLREEAAKSLAIPAALVPQQLLEAATGALGPRPADEDLDPEIDDD